MKDSEPKLPDPQRTYLKDEIDLAAYRLYLQSKGLRGVAGFHPPERPDGWLNDGEEAAWDRWRAKAQATETERGR